MMHDGTEYVGNPTKHQTDFAHAAVDAGAAIVIGTHPHVVQTMETYQGKYIYYSLGNFIFDQMWSKDTQRGMSLLVTVDKSGVTDVDYMPVKIEDYCRPVLATGAERDIIMERL
jgi:poly-gamma-glutamate synthesis protein (capsule biosynthesis protein)